MTQAPAGSHNRLAVIDLTKPSPQFISLSSLGHKHLDLMIASLLTVAIVHTRKSKMILQNLASARVYHAHNASFEFAWTYEGWLAPTGWSTLQGCASSPSEGAFNSPATYGAMVDSEVNGVKKKEHRKKQG